jgi:hypothetical protein
VHQNQNENNIFFTLLKCHIKTHSSGDDNGNVVSSNQIHLMYNGVKHVIMLNN